MAISRLTHNTLSCQYLYQCNYLNSRSSSIKFYILKFFLYLPEGFLYDMYDPHVFSHR